jgi:Rps23 Pro-64 3,4-dihydroxylase Tpa1-like proline 4-hydroxylase
MNPDHDPHRLAEAFRASGRLQIANFLHPQDAERLLVFLKSSNAWRLVINSNDQFFELDRKAQAELTADQQAQLDEAVYAGARYGFQYRYETIRVPDAAAERTREPTPLNDFAVFLSGEPVLRFLRIIIGNDDISFADAQATAYAPGHFLTAHDDEVAGKDRRAAYVMNLSKDWSVDWGGLLTFHHPDASAAEAFVPRFNTLNLFAVPQRHSVGIVAPFAPRRRYSVTGWLRAGSPP